MNSVTSMIKTAFALTLMLAVTTPAGAATCWFDGDQTAIVVSDAAGEMNGDFSVAIGSWEGVLAQCSWFNDDQTFDKPKAPASINCNLGSYAVKSLSEHAIAVADMKRLRAIDCHADASIEDFLQAMINDLVARAE